MIRKEEYEERVLITCVEHMPLVVGYIEGNSNWSQFKMDNRTRECGRHTCPRRFNKKNLKKSFEIVIETD